MTSQQPHPQVSAFPLPRVSPMLLVRGFTATNRSNPVFTTPWQRCAPQRWGGRCGPQAFSHRFVQRLGPGRLTGITAHAFDGAGSSSLGSLQRMERPWRRNRARPQTPSVSHCGEPASRSPGGHRKFIPARWPQPPLARLQRSESQSAVRPTVAWAARWPDPAPHLSVAPQARLIRTGYSVLNP
jgi:hypothetical protein